MANATKITKALSITACFIAYVVFILMLAVKDLESFKFALPYVSGILFCALVAISVIRDNDSQGSNVKKPKVKITVERNSEEPKRVEQQ